MTGCPEWRDAVAGCALDDTPKDPALAAHLEICPGCAEALRESRRAAARMDAALYRLAAVEPPPYGPDRVMARVAGRNPAGIIRWWKWAAVGSLAAILIALVLWMRQPPPPADAAALAAWRSPTDSLLLPPVSAAWNTMPRLGEGLFSGKPLGEIHVQ